MTEEKPPLDRHSDAWIRHLRPWLLLRVEDLRDELERPGSDPDFIRGKIDELRNLMRQIEPELPEEGTSSTYFPTGEAPS